VISEQCSAPRRLYSAESREQALTCAHCGGAFWRPAKLRDERRFCSRQCYGASRTARSQATRRAARRRVCIVCQASFVMVTRRRLTCSDPCAESYRRGVVKAWHRGHAQSAISTRCATCHAPMTVRTGEMGRPKRFCSSRCRDHGEASGRRIASAKRRAQQRNAPSEQVDPLAVFTRDRWTCQLCGSLTPSHLRGTHDARAPELDHIVALARGGSHTYANTQCACRQCNHTKSDRVSA
jgi:5-methylcytosine-specific restriction endonuclease McrA